MPEPENPPIPLATSNEEIPTELLLCSEKMTDFLADISEHRDEESRTSEHIPEEGEEVTSSYSENPSDILRQSELQKPHLIFECTVKPVTFLKSAVEALIDQNESGRLGVDHLGFNITVRNLGNNSMGHLRLKPSEFGCCSRQSLGKTINLHGLSQNLARVEDEGTIRVNCQKGNIDRLDFLVSGDGFAIIRAFCLVLLATLVLFWQRSQLALPTLLEEEETARFLVEQIFLGTLATGRRYFQAKELGDITVRSDCDWDYVETRVLDYAATQIPMDVTLIAPLVLVHYRLRDGRLLGPRGHFLSRPFGLTSFRSVSSDVVVASLFTFT